MQVTQQSHRTPLRGLFLSLLILFVSNVVSAQEAGPPKTTINMEAIEKTLSESVEKNKVALSPEDHAEIIRYLLNTIKNLQAENERLRLEYEKARTDTADKLNTIEVRLTEIENRKTSRNETDSSTKPRISRIPRYDSDYDLINF